MVGSMFVSTEGLPGPVMVNRFGKPGHRHAEVGAWPLAPFLLQRQSATAADVDLQQRAGHGVEAGGEHDGVDLVLLAPGADALLGDLLDRLVADIDQLHVGPVERLVVADIDAQPLAADGVTGREQLGQLRIGHLFSDLVAHEIGCGNVGVRHRPSGP